MAAPEAIAELVERFDRNVGSYRSGQYNETQLRREFIDPFFKALGWDVENERGYAEAYKDVVHGDAIKVGASTKAPDYSFRIGGLRKFFVEAKKPSVNLKDEISPAFQLRRYSWSAKLPLGILTDFEELAVYDGRVPPAKNDKPSQARVKYFTYREYIDRWDEIASIFSREEVLKGSFDRYVESTRAKRGTAEVDAAFLREIEAWRDLLARNIALRNPNLTARDLNFAVQRTIDRIVFLRICEDRGIERYGSLQALLEGGRVYPRLCELFRRADERYNSGLFHFSEDPARREPPDGLTPGLEIDDKVLKDIIRNLYYPESPYEFSVLPPEILGQVYEQFLGKVISLTPGHRAKVEYKPEVRKAGGVYYTPSYIVGYIVQETVARLLAGQTPAAVSSLRILDPACGSGSFLIGAYQRLLDWHRDWYVEKLVPLLEAGHPSTSKEIQALLPGGGGAASRSGAGRGNKTKKGKAEPSESPFPIFQAKGGEWKLTTEERKRILLQNIYGVDIDPAAVEVTKLSLHLKVLEGESEETLSKQLKLFEERALPDLGENVKCGNSLIGYDEQTTLLDGEERDRVNAFDWGTEFSEIMGRGGFDVVIGNPPYIRIQAMKQWAPLEVEYYKEHYEAAKKGNYDIYVVFVEKGLSLLNERGLLGFILPHKFFNAKYGTPLRSMIAEGRNLEKIVHFGYNQVFEGATTYTCLLFLNGSYSNQFEYIVVDDLLDWSKADLALNRIISTDKVTDSEWNFVVGHGVEIFEKLSKMPSSLGDIANIFVGLQTSADPIFLFKESQKSKSLKTVVYSKQLGQNVEIESDLLKSVIRSGDIGRYWAKPTALVLFPYIFNDTKFRLIHEAEMKNKYPRAWEYFVLNKTLLSGREHGKFKDSGWYQLYPKNLDLWEQPKIMVPYMITRLSAFYDECLNYFVNVTTGGFGITIDQQHGSMKYITGLLNSNLLDWFLKNISTNFRGGYFAANKQFLVQLPIRTIDFSDPEDVVRHDKMVGLVERMLELHKRLAEARSGHEKTLLSRQIEATDEQIDALVYELYGLTAEEIEIVEEAAR